MERDLHFTQASAATTSTGITCLMGVDEECEDTTEKAGHALLSDPY